ncbi:MAG: hypothetical protein ACFFF4_12670 [Candidatus Thorarchaeota archaeon]
MEDWQEETLRYFWRKMKIDNCLISEYYEQYGHLQRDYAFPNGLFIKCKLESGGFPYATMTLKVGKTARGLFEKILNDYKHSSNDHGWHLQYKIEVSSQGALTRLLWKLYELDYTQYVPAIPQDTKVNCPECRALLAFDSSSDAIWIKCRNCGHEIFLGGQRYELMGN